MNPLLNHATFPNTANNGDVRKDEFLSVVIIIYEVTTIYLI